MIGSWAIGIAIGSLASISMCVGLVALNAYVTSPVFHELLRSAKTRNALEQESRKNAIGNLLPQLVMVPLIVIYVILPLLSEDDEDGHVFGTLVRPMVWFMVVSLALQSFVILPLNSPLGQVVPVENAKFTTTLIENYMENVRATMLASDDVEEQPTRAMFDRLSKHQARVESWAHHLSDGLSTSNGVMLVMMVTWTFLPVVLLGLHVGSSTFGAGGIAMLSFLTLTFFFGFTQMLRAVTIVNRTFIRQKIRTLNDARLVPVIERSFRFRNHFIEWLDTHEISATRAFGIRVTTKRMAEAVGVVGSLLLVMGTLIVQKHAGM